MRPCRVPLIVACACLGQSGLAESPSVTRALPAAAMPGKTTEVTFFGSNLEDASWLWSSLSMTADAAERGTDSDKATFHVTVPADVPAGIGGVRVATPGGISSLALFMIDDLPSTSESGDNGSAGEAQRLDLPAAVDGHCDSKGFDFFRFSVNKAESLSIEVVAQRLGSKLDPVIRLLDAEGRELAYSDDAPGLGRDCRFAWKAPSDGECFLELRDMRYRGGDDYRYRLRLGDFPLATVPFPLGARLGTTVEFTLAGPAVAGVEPVTVTVPEEVAGGTLHLAVRYPGGRRSAFVSAVTGGAPEETEEEPNDIPEKATRIEVPSAVNGRFAARRDVDHYRFEAFQGQRLVFRGMARSLGSPSELLLRLEDAGGVALATAGVSGASEGRLEHAFAADGTYHLVAEELSQRGGPDFAYRVEIVPSRPFALSLETDKVEARPGGVFSTKVICERSDYDGAIALSVQGGGGGLVVEKGMLERGKKETMLEVRLPESLKPGKPLEVRVLGRARIGEVQYEAAAGNRAALKKLFPAMPYPPMELIGSLGLGVRAE